MSALETIAVVLALAYVLLAMRQSRLCWVAAFTSALLYLVIFAEVKLYMEAGLQIVYAAMAVVGWIFWGKDKTAETLPVTSRPLAISRDGATRHPYRDLGIGIFAQRLHGRSKTLCRCGNNRLSSRLHMDGHPKNTRKLALLDCYQRGFSLAIY